MRNSPAVMTAYATVLFACASASSTRAADPPLRLQSIVGGLTQPIFVAHAPNDPSRLFIVEQRGKIKILRNGALIPTPFVDVGPLMTGSDGYVLEYGLLGLAFHPEFETNGYFYVNYTVGTVSNADTVISRFRVSQANPNIADPATRQQILRIPYTLRNHRAGWIDFDDEGYLYIPTGDGGEQDPQNNASNRAVLMGKVLRIDVNGPDGEPGTADDDGFPADNNKHYHIPATNPFVGQAGVAPEIFAYGLRNAWRCSFDRETGDMWIGDVGQLAREEVDLIPAGTSGTFFGWRCMEGNLPTGYAGCTNPLPASTPPVYDYPRSQGTAVIGGYVYRGCAMPALRGTYFFGDWNNAIWSFRYEGGGVTNFTNRRPELPIASTLVSFGEDFFGELYVCRWTATQGQFGEILKIVPVTPQPAGDVDCDGDIDLTDLSTLLSSFGLCSGTLGFVATADFNADGCVDLPDLAVLLANFGL